ncbi:hypothetical protein [Reyranella sp.]|uniref:hypothetical protein n=1 Tax=Reyranella sp. TaxID=1929291 RepID=UPI0011F768A0|nr:hypothetical protein [Reyranella sp.]TAJ83072.1 MAG: hypothetical protein EPO50_24420 [Reyranella sp.]
MAIARHVVATPCDLDWRRDWDLLALSVVVRCFAPAVKFAEPDKNTGMKVNGTPSVIVLLPLEEKAAAPIEPSKKKSAKA